jgi:hypothetical protein
VPGPVGPAGSTGPAGPGIAAGGTTSQKLTKKSATDYDTQWNPAWAENAYVGPNAPPGTPKVGDVWYDTDDPNPLTLPLSIVSGGTGATTAAGARSGLAVPAIGNSTTVGGAPTTGAWARGDQWLDSAGVVWTCTVAGTPGTWTAPPGTELAYNQITAGVNITATVEATAQPVITGSSRTYDGSPILIEINLPSYSTVLGQFLVLNLWDGATDLGRFGSSSSPVAGSIYNSAALVRRVVPSVGSHAYSLYAWNTAAGTANLQCGPGGAGTYPPAFIRVTRA